MSRTLRWIGDPKSRATNESLTTPKSEDEKSEDKFVPYHEKIAHEFAEEARQAKEAEEARKAKEAEEAEEARKAKEAEEEVIK